MSAKKTNSVDFAYLGDKKVEKGRKQLIDESASWKKPAHKERQEQQREAIKKVKKDHARGQERVSWKKRVGGIAAIVFLCGVGLFQFISQIAGLIMGSGITTLDVQDTATLKRVLFGGDPWLVYCVDNQTEHQKLPPVLTESAWSLRRGTGLQMGTLRCWDTTESGRSVAQRFKMKLKPPLAFVVANGNKPRTLDLVGISKPEVLEKRVKPALSLEIRKIDTLKKWSNLCTSRRACVVIGHRQTAQRDTATTLLRPLHESHRGVQIVTLDTSFWQLKLDEGLLKSRPGAGGEGGSKRADVLCIARQDGAANATYLGKFLDSLDSTAATALLTDCGQQSDLLGLKESPRIKARPSKPKKVTPPPPRPAPKPSPPAARPKESKKTNVDHVGSRQRMESEEEELFEAVDEEAEDESAQEEEDDSEEEVEL